MNTHTFKLPSGIECELTGLTGKQQEILTQQNKKPHNEKLAEVLQSVIVRIGTMKNPSLAFIKNDMLTCDRNAALVELRQYSLDFEDEFIFMFKYKGEDGSKKEVEISEKVTEGKFPTRSIHKIVTTDEGVEFEPVQYTDYSEIDKHVYITLPKTGTKVRFTLLDGKGESIGIATKKNTRSSHTVVYMRNPVYFKSSKDDKEIPVRINLSDLPIKDIEYLRTMIKNCEGRVDTEILFDNPATDKEEIMDVISSVAFFFPSEAI